MTTLTLHHGNARAEYVEHPFEVARRALLEAAEHESPEWADALRRFARALPARQPIKRQEG